MGNTRLINAVYKVYPLSVICLPSSMTYGAEWPWSVFALSIVIAAVTAIPIIASVTTIATACKVTRVL